ncbi:MAG: hypothetical protein M1814_003996 [Vezdaea aestivalis]|nr:MAG: hypothetical protein M1814_003996 [Vezdaea aestivalis]
MSNFLEKTRAYSHRPGPGNPPSDRPWEQHRSHSHTSTPHQQLPSISDLTSGIPAYHGPSPDSRSQHSASSIRDSGNWSMNSPSKHTSVISTASNSLQLPSINQERSSPQRASTSSGPDSSTFSPSFSSRPGSHQHPLSPNSDYPRSTLSSTLSSTYENGSRHSGSDFPADGISRRSSIDSRMNSGMNSLALGATSPYNGSANPSQASLVSGLQQQRGIPNGHHIRPGFGTPKKAQSILGINTMAESQRRFPGGRIAPPIDPNPRSQWPNPHAATPTKGFPYAFPDPDAEVIHEDEEVHTVPEPPRIERRGSFGAASVTSSVFTNDSRMPGQRKLDDSTPGISSPADPDAVNLHHHQLQHTQLSTLIDDDDESEMGLNGATPYSRTPELRVSHKLAERKRRSEMKHLFEDLRQKIPADGRVNKASKWEVLVKAIDYIKQLESTCNETQRHALHWRNEANEAHALRAENLELRAEMQRLTSSMHHQQAAQSSQSQPSQPPPPQAAAAAAAPPPPAGQTAGGGAMQGVQYGS